MRKALTGIAAFGMFFAAGAQPAFGQTLPEDIVDELPISDLQVELSDEPDPVGVNTTLTYKVSLKNGGTSDVDNNGLLFNRDGTIRVTTKLAPTLTNIQAEPSEGDTPDANTCGEVDPGQLTVVCTFDNLEGGLFSGGERAQIEITATPTAQGFVRATSRIESPNFDFASGSNEDREGTQVVPNCDGLSPTVVGTGGPELLQGSVGKDVILGLGGDDVIKSFSGNDVICAGQGNDTVKSGGGNDRVFGQAGDDRVKQSGGNDYAEGNAGGDLLEGEENADQLFGGVGGDTLTGGPANDLLNGGPDRDRCVGGPGTNTLRSCEF